MSSSGYVGTRRVIAAPRLILRLELRQAATTIVPKTPAVYFPGASHRPIILGGNVHILEELGISLPIVQAPMAGVSTPAMAAAVSNAGALGSLGLGATPAEGAVAMIRTYREQSDRPLHVNVFCHAPPIADPALDAAWLARLRPHFARYGAAPPVRLTQIYRTFLEDEPMLRSLLANRPEVLSFHFGLPGAESIRALRGAGIVLLASATSVAEGRAAVRAGVDAVIAQGYEAGGHRGIFDPAQRDERLGTLVLTRLLVRELGVPVIAAGGIMDGASISAVLRLGAVAAQLGTAFITCSESAADLGYRAALLGEAAKHTVMTRIISGRPARCLANRFTALDAEVQSTQIPPYPMAYDAGKALHAAARTLGEYGYGAQWAGQGAAMARSMPAAELVALLAQEMR